MNDRKLFISPRFPTRKLESREEFMRENWVTVQCVARRTSDPDFQECTDVLRRTFEDHDLVTARPARQSRWICFARSFAQNLDLFADEWFAPAFCPGIDQFEQVMISGFFHGIGDLLLHLCGWRALALRIFKDKCIVETDPIHKRTRLGIVVLGFTGKTNDNIRGDRDFRRLRNEFDRPARRISRPCRFDASPLEFDWNRTAKANEYAQRALTIVQRIRLNRSGNRSDEAR